MATTRETEPRTVAAPAPDRLGAELGLSDEQLREMYTLVAMARAIDERMWVLNRAGKVPFVISGQGHEGAQVGIAYDLRRRSDWLVPFYRSVAMVMTFGMSPREIMLAQFARAVDPSSGGRQMPGHYGAARHNILSTSSPVATQVLHAVGIAYAAKVRGTGQVAMTALGEGASNQGDFHEALNFAGIHRLPVVFVVENNGYAISVPARFETAVPDIAIRAQGYAMPGVIVDGADVLGCYAAGREAIARARRGDGATLIEAKVTRLTAHSSDDQQTKYRSADELERERGRDPLPLFRQQLAGAGVLDDEREAAIAREIAAAVDDATDWAEAQPEPDPQTATRHVYAGEPLDAVDEPSLGGPWGARPSPRDGGRSAREG
ncbi:MAG TPA: thiamine pyrophosphate-dependent dehydrogenase E1 component subunit alpha [Candidatus Limnocylindrales bacterium]|jgi:2-oxoisovalerate dehydrogenase E1 component alpha subunit|nr:thiamine pyrophosphate-dependent dehydrogenase E1 component subunit alpha [Candidatus Limnocylindrales bacterium]